MFSGPYEYTTLAAIMYSWQDLVVITFCSMHTVSGIPTGLDYIELQSRSVTLLWEQLSTTERCSPLILYSVRVEAQQQQELCNAQQQMELNTTNTNAVITGLCPHSLYRISVKACTEVANMCGEYSSSLVVCTLEDGMCHSNNNIIIIDRC
jgi:hypothetical protein